MGVAPGEHLSSAGQQNLPIQWWWVWWSSSNRHWRNSSLQSERRLQLQYTVCSCMKADPPGPCSPKTPLSSVSQGLSWLFAAGSGQRCWSSPPSSGTWPVSEEFPGLHKTYRRSCQHQCVEQHGHNLQSHSILKVIHVPLSKVHSRIKLMLHYTLQ